MSVAAVILIDATAPFGPIVPTPTGFQWHLLAVVRNTADNHKELLQGYSANTLDADTLVQVRDKMIAATKTAAIAAGFPTLDIAVVNSMSIVNPVP